MNMGKFAFFCELKFRISFVRRIKPIVPYVTCYGIAIWRTLIKLAGAAGYRFWNLYLI